MHFAEFRRWTVPILLALFWDISGTKCVPTTPLSPLCFNCYRRTIILKNFFQLNILSRRKLVFFLFEWKSFLHWFIAPSLFSTRRRNKRWWNNAQDRLVEYVIVISKRLMKVKCCFGSELKMASHSPLYRIFLIESCGNDSLLRHRLF